MSHYEIITRGWEYMPGTVDAYQARLDVQRDGLRWDSVPVRMSAIEVLRVGATDEDPRHDDELWSALLEVAAAEVQSRIREGRRPSESTRGASVYPSAPVAAELLRAGHARSIRPLISTFDLDERSF